MNQINKHFNEVTTEAIQLKAQIELEIKLADFLFDSYFNNNNYSDFNNNRQNRNGIDDEFYEENALIVQEKDEDLDCDSRTLRAKNSKASQSSLVIS